MLSVSAAGRAVHEHWWQKKDPSRFGRSRFAVSRLETQQCGVRLTKGIVGERPFGVGGAFFDCLQEDRLTFVVHVVVGEHHSLHAT